jgi:hypothetical protein
VVVRFVDIDGDCLIFLLITCYFIENKPCHPRESNSGYKRRFLFWANILKIEHYILKITEIKDKKLYQQN